MGLSFGFIEDAIKDVGDFAGDVIGGGLDIFDATVIDPIGDLFGLNDDKRSAGGGYITEDGRTYRTDRQKELDRELWEEDLRQNPLPVPGPQQSPTMMSGLNIQQGVNPFAAAAQRAGFSDFQNLRNPTNTSSLPAMENINGGLYQPGGKMPPQITPGSGAGPAVPQGFKQAVTQARNAQTGPNIGAPGPAPGVIPGLAGGPQGGPAGNNTSSLSAALRGGSSDG